MTNRQRARAVQLVGAGCMIVGLATYSTSDSFAAWLVIGLVAVIGGKAWEYMQRE